MKTALITGVTGQDGAYLAELLLQKGYSVHGLLRRTSLPNTGRIDHLIDNYGSGLKSLHLHYGDMTDTSSLSRILDIAKPDEVYNLAAQSHVHVSFDEPEYTANSDALGTLRLLEILRSRNYGEAVRFYQASTSELYGKVQQVPQNEDTAFYPRSPLCSGENVRLLITVNYREAYGMFACNGILFNHESPIRGQEFVTRKITRALTRIKMGKQKTLKLGNLDARRDWGHARDYVEAQWLMLQQDQPHDLVIATGLQHSVKDFIKAAAGLLDMDLRWEGKGLEEKVYWANCPFSVTDKSWLNPIIHVDKSLFRPTEVETLLGDSARAKELLGWQPKISFEKLVEEMVFSDLRDVSVGG